MPTDYLPLFVALALGYLSGSIPFGLILTRAAGLGDIRNIGSGNIGATNVLRTGNKKIAAATLVLDALKAAVPVLVARHFWGEEAAMLAAVGAFFGHCFPVWLGFKGGKGVAVMIGSLLALAWPVGLIFCPVWLLIAFVLQLPSLAASPAAASATMFGLRLGSPLLARSVGALALFLFLQLRESIARLRAGTEPTIGGSKKAA